MYEFAILEDGQFITTEITEEIAMEIDRQTIVELIQNHCDLLDIDPFPVFRFSLASGHYYEVTVGEQVGDQIRPDGYTITRILPSHEDEDDQIKVDDLAEE